MDPRLLQAYNDELAYLRESAKEFGEENDVIAGYLGLKRPNDPDPYVERLLEGAAFLSARVNLKLQDQFPEFSQHLLQAVQPNYLSPQPSMCVVSLDPADEDPAIADGFTVAAGTEVTATVAGTDTPVRFRTAHAVELRALKVESAEYLSSTASVAASAATAGVRAVAGLKLRIAATGEANLSQHMPDRLPLYVHGTEAVPGELYRQIIGDTLAVLVIPDKKGAAGVVVPNPLPYGFDEDQAMLPNDGRAFRGYRLLSEYFACPQRFMFAELSGLKTAVTEATKFVDIIFLFRRSTSTLIKAVSAENLRLFATPMVNLFELQLGRISLSPYEHEHMVTPDRTRPNDYQVFRILDVVAHDRNATARPVEPLYAFGTLLYDWREALFYVPRQRLRRVPTRQRRGKTKTDDYVYTETLVSLVSPGNPARLDEIRELGIRALVTNRDLAMTIRYSGENAGFSIDGQPVRQVSLLSAPTRPRPPLGMMNATSDPAWRVIGHLTPNYGSLLESKDGNPQRLRDHLALYGREDDPVMRRHIDSLVEIRTEGVTRRIGSGHTMAFARGKRVRLKLDDTAFENGQMFLFASVIDRFLAEFVSINSFVETVFESPEQGEFIHWPLRTGQRPTI